MKKLITIIFAIALSFGVFAQSDTLFIHKGGQIISEYAVAEIDSIVFFRTQATTPLPTDTIVRVDTVFITLPPDTIVLTDTVFITFPPDTIVLIDTVFITLPPDTIVRIDTVFINPITDIGVVINGVRWATRNVDMPNSFTENPESLGMLYQWNRRTGWAATGIIVSGWNNTTPTGSTWERANDPCPPGWRIPTAAELQTLTDTNNVSSQWTSLNGVNGNIFTDINTNDTIFFPAAGWRSSVGNLNGAGASVRCVAE